MSCIRDLPRVALLALFITSAHAAEEKKSATNDPPKITMAVPFAVVPGATNRIKIRGLNLTNATQVRFHGVTTTPTAEIKSRGKAMLPDKADPKKLGDSQLEVELFLPADFAVGDLPFNVTTSDGDTNTNLLRVVEGKILFDEKEPNGGFRQPNDIQLPQTIRGVIDPANDVDVFRFTGRAGQKIRIESLSGRFGSTLDPILSLHDAAGHTLATSDDTMDGLDAALQFTLLRGGSYFLSIIDAHDRGGPTYGYLVTVSAE